jgi:hypothetical protein
MKTLMLDSTWRPINFVKQHRAVIMLLAGKVELITAWDGEAITSPSYSMEVPAVIRLKHYVGGRFGRPRFRRKILFTRDSWSCQYCAAKLGWKNITIDHVIPRCSGGKTTWENCVAACWSCNEKKGKKSLKEAGMKLLSQPKEPKPQHFWNLYDHIDHDRWHPEWSVFLKTDPITVDVLKDYLENP